MPGVTLLLARQIKARFYLNGENKGTAQATSAGLTYFDGVNPDNLLQIGYLNRISKIQHP